MRLVSVCDVYAALIERRSYKPALDLERAYGVMQGMGGALDSDLVGAFRPIATSVPESARRSI